MKSVIQVLVLSAVLSLPAAAAERPPAGGDTLRHVVPLPGVEVSTTRPGDRAPIARSVLDRAAIERANWGQDTPMALASLPGAYAYSDAGNGIGYSYLSIRGFPQRRISVLVDGVPLNDPESHEVYWIDHPDLLASTAEAEVQRGVGSALYGAASLGGSVNLETAPLSDTPRTTLLTGVGEWNTRRWMLEMNSGRVGGAWNWYGRYSRIETDGYREQSWSRLWSYYFAARRIAGNHVFRLNLFGGPEETHLAYAGITRDELQRFGRRYNPITYAGEQDHFFEPHYELLHSWTFSPSLALSQTLFWFDGRGYYDEQRFGKALTDYRLNPWTTTDTTLFPHDYYQTDSNGNVVLDAQGRATVTTFDPVRRRTVVNRHFGWIPRVRWAHAGGALTAGGEVRWHDGRHTGEVLSGSALAPGTPPNWVYYDYHPRTLAAGLFLREEWNARPELMVTADLGWRHQAYAMRDDRYRDIRFDQPYDFALPRLGLTWTPRADLRVFGSWAWARREPAFRDLYDAEDASSVPLFRRVNAASGMYEDPMLKPETVNHAELGAAWSRGRAALTLNLFRMDFRDELVPFQYNADVNTWTSVNAARSIHQGAEAAGRLSWALPRGATLALGANGTFSDNHFVRYTEVLDAGVELVRDGRVIPFFPALLANASARLGWRGATLGLEARHAGRVFLWNDESDANSLEPRTVLDLDAGWGRDVGGARATLGLRVLNLTDRRYFAGGYMDYDASYNLVPFTVPAATRSVMGEVRLEF